MDCFHYLLSFLLHGRLEPSDFLSNFFVFGELRFWTLVFLQIAFDFPTETPPLTVHWELSNFDNYAFKDVRKIATARDR